MGWGKEEGSPAVLPAPPSPPASPSAQAAAQCENSAYSSHSGDLSGAPRGCSLPTPWAVQLAPRESRPLSSFPVTTSFSLCVASEQPAGCNYRLGLFRAVIAAGQHIQQVDSRRRRDSFFKCSFSGSSFCTAADRECRLTRKAALKESFLILFYGGRKKIVLLHEVR